MFKSQFFSVKKKKEKKEKKSPKGAILKAHPPTQERATIKNKMNPLENMHQLRERQNS